MPRTLSPTVFARLTTSALLVAVTCLATSAAHAGTYTVDSCRHADGTLAPVDGWTDQGGAPLGAGVVRNCASGGAITAFMEHQSASNHGGGSTVGFQFATGNASLVPVSATVWQAAVLSDAAPGARWVALLSAPNANLDSATIIDGPSGQGTWGIPSQTLSDGNRRDIKSDHLGHAGDIISSRIFCDGGPSWTYCGGDAAVSLYRASIRIEDVAPPSGSVSAAPATPPTYTGTISERVSGADQGVGLARAVLMVDGKEVGSGTYGDNGGHCVPVKGIARLYDWVQPCPASGIAQPTWDTTNVADGEHKLQVVVEDAAGNRTTVGTRTVITRNASSIGPGSPLAVRGAENGSPADDHATLVAGWSGTARRGKPSATKLTRNWSAKLGDTIVGGLGTATGTPIRDAVIDVVTTSAMSGAAETLVGTTTTGGDGSFSYELPRSAGSMGVAVRYRARQADTVPAASASATRTVRASTSLAAPRRAPRGARITLSGELRGRAGNVARLPISLQVRAGGRWRTFATAQTGTRGKWRRTVRFASTPGRYPVRARIGTSVAYPYGRGVSRVTSIRVR